MYANQHERSPHLAIPRKDMINPLVKVLDELPMLWGALLFLYAVLHTHTVRMTKKASQPVRWIPSW